MHDLEPYTGPTKLVLAFDIGVTKSRISYCHLKPGQVPEILGVSRFPAHASGGLSHVPSVLCYDNAGNVKAAGAEVLCEDVIEQALEEGWTKAEWWRLHIDRPNHLVSDDLPPLPPKKSAVDVLTDFIKYLFQCSKTYILKRHLAFEWSTIEDSIEYIFTHQNGLEGAQQQIYRQAIEHAGLIPSTPEGQSRVHLLTEGEARLHFCVSNLDTEAAYDTPRGVVIIHAGSGTIDLSMFSVSSNPISCEETAPAECRLQGSVFVTRRANRLIQRKLEGWERSSEGDIYEFTQEFDRTTKLVIESDQDVAWIKVAGRRYNNPKYNILFGKLKLSGTEATGLFKDSIDAVIEAFEQQLKSVTMPITIAFLVGGLSSNDWFWSQLHSYFKDRNIHTYRPDNQINRAVPNGAVLSFINHENHLATSRVARVTYGIIYALPVDDDNERHLGRKGRWETDPTGDRYVPGHFEAKLYKGTPVGEGMELRESFSLMECDPKDFGLQCVHLACYRGNLPNPEWVDEDPSSFSTLCIIRADLGQAVNDLVLVEDLGRVFYELDYEVVVLFGLTEIRAQLHWKARDGSERRAPAIVSYA